MNRTDRHHFFLFQYLSHNKHNIVLPMDGSPIFSYEPCPMLNDDASSTGGYHGRVHDRQPSKTTYLPTDRPTYRRKATKTKKKQLFVTAPCIDVYVGFSDVQPRLTKEEGITLKTNAGARSVSQGFNISRTQAIFLLTRRTLLHEPAPRRKNDLSK